MKTISVLSLGGGSPSTALALAIALKMRRGSFDFGSIELASVTFADTGGERRETYAHIPEVSRRLEAASGRGVSVVRKKGATLRESILQRLRGERQSAPAIPAYLAPTGRAAQHCTRDFKARPLDSFHRQVQRELGADAVEVLIGFTIEELLRIPSKFPKDWPSGWTRRYPLIEAGANRGWCDDVCLEVLGYVPVSSACEFCPHRPDVGPGSRAEIRAADPEAWDRIVEFDAAIRDGRSWGLNRHAFLSRRLVPVALAEESANRQGVLPLGVEGCDSGNCLL